MKNNEYVKLSEMNFVEGHDKVVTLKGLLALLVLAALLLTGFYFEYQQALKFQKYTENFRQPAPTHVYCRADDINCIPYNWPSQQHKLYHRGQHPPF